VEGFQSNLQDLTKNEGLAQQGANSNENPLDSSLKNREWITTEEAAKYLALSIGALRNMASNGQVPYHKLGRRNRYNVVELRQLLLSQRRGGYYGN